MDERSQKFFKTKPRGINQEVVLPDFPDDDNTTTTTFTKSRRVSFGTNFIKEFIVGSAVSAQCVTEYERAFSSSDSSNANSSHSALESGVFEKDTYVLEESHKSNHMPPPEPETVESRAKVPKISSTICFSADSPTTEMEFTEGCISLAKSILDKKNKDMTVIIQANSKNEDKGKTEETKIFEGSQFDMSMTKCFKPKENKIEERRFECDKTRIFSKFDDEISFTRCSRVFETQQSGNVDDESDCSWMGDGQKENQIPLDLIMKHLDKDDSNFENFLFNPEKRLNDVLSCKPVDISNDSEKLNWNESMDISNDSPKFTKSVLDELKSGTDVIQKVAEVFEKKSEDSFLETLPPVEEIQKESPEEMEITFVKELEVSSDVTLGKVVSSVEVEVKDICGVTFVAEKMEVEEVKNVFEDVGLNEEKVAEEEERNLSCVEKENSIREEIPKGDESVIHTSSRHSVEKLETSKVQVEDVIHDSTHTQAIENEQLLQKPEEIPPLENSLSKPEEASVSEDKLVPPSPECHDEIPESNDSLKECQDVCGVTFTADKMEVEEVKNDQEEEPVDLNEDKVEGKTCVDKEISLNEEISDEKVTHESTPPENIPLNTPNQHSEQTEVSKTQDERVIHECTLPENIPLETPIQVENIEETPNNVSKPDLTQENIESKSEEIPEPSEIVQPSQPPCDEKMEEDIEVTKNVQNVDMSLTKAHLPDESSHYDKSLADDSMNDFMNVEEEKDNELLNSKGEVSLTGLVEMDETLEEMNATKEQPVKEQAASAENSPLEITACFMNMKVVKSLEEQSTEPGCVWSLKDFNNPQRNSRGCISFCFNLLEDTVVIKFDLKVSNEDDLEPCKVVQSEVYLEVDHKLRLPEYKTVLDFGFEKFSKYFREVCKEIGTINHISFFLDQVNLFVQKTNPFLQQVYSILTLYPRSKLENSTLSFRLFSFPVFFSCDVFVNLSDFSKLSKSSLTFSFDFGSLDKKKIAEIFEECLKLENALCEFIIKSTEFIIELEQKTGRISRRKHIRLLSTGKKA